jgi:hypothetical protein
MNRDRDFDHTLRQWLDDGADRAPERYVWAALENVDRTPQRGAWRALLERTIMKLKPAAPILGVAAVVLLAIAAFQYLGGNVGDPRQPTPQPSATPRHFTSADLPSIVFTEENAPEELTVDGVTTGYDAVTTPLRAGGDIIPLTGFEEALMTNLSSTEAGGYVTWSAVYGTTEEADRAFDFLVAEHESAEGWGLTPQVPPAPGLGDEEAFYVGAAYDFDDAHIYLWRVGNLLLAAVAVDVEAVAVTDADRLESVAREMAARAN